jgi:hypothetical protein
MDDVSERFLEARSALEHVADELTPEEAAATLDDAALQLFWPEWPQLGSWAGTLWRQLNEDLAGPSSAVGEPELDEVGGARVAEGQRDRDGRRVAEGIYG